MNARSPALLETSLDTLADAADFKASLGLHILKDRCSKKYMGVQSSYLAVTKHLQQAIEATNKAAQLRENYRVNREFKNSQDIAESQRERLWEQAVFQRWHFTQKAARVESCWVSLVSYQVPLFAQRDKEHWGYIDLLGLQEDGTPVVVELKKEPKARSNGSTHQSECPLRMILEAAAYAVAIKKNWALFRNELKSLQNGGHEIPVKIPDKVETVQLVGAAPASYWLDWLPVTRKGQSSLSKEVWKSFHQLLHSLQIEGFPVSFVSLSGDPSNPQQLAAQPLIGFPDRCYF